MSPTNQSLYLLLLFSILISPSRTANSIFDRQKKCQPIEIGLCKDTKYNYTIYPNMFHSYDQQTESASSAEHFKPLIKTNCSPHILFFVCSVFAPMCPEDILPQAVTSCRSVCEEVKKDCLKILHDFNVEWPEMLNCSRFPQSPELCMKPTNTDEGDSSYGSAKSISTGRKLSAPGREFLEPVPSCPKDMVNLDPGDPNGACALQCGADFMFQREHKQFAEYWMLGWSLTCLVVTGLVVVTFLMDRKRFRYPERSIIYLAMCYFCYSWAYVGRLFASFERVACESQRSGDSYLVGGSLDNPLCVLTFMCLYYFSMASALWWVILTFTWYLSACRKWAPEAVESWSSYFHFVAWGAPALLSVAVLITHKVDASELTGLCFVGNWDPLALISFVIGPRLLLVLIGCCFIIAGFPSMCAVCYSLRNQGTDTKNLEKLMFKIGVSSLLYVVPVVVVIGCDVYHALLLREWTPSTIHCKLSGGAESGGCPRPDVGPQVQLYMLKIFMSLIVGTASGVWVASAKTCYTWQNCLCCGLLSGPPGRKYPGEVTYGGPATKPLMTTSHQDGGHYANSRTSTGQHSHHNTHPMSVLPHGSQYPTSTSHHHQYQQQNQQPSSTQYSNRRQNFYHMPQGAWLPAPNESDSSRIV